MDLFILGAGMGVVGGIFPNPLLMIALTQVALGRWLRAIGVLIGAPLAVDGCLLLLTCFFYGFIPAAIAHDVAYVGGVVLIGFACYSLWELRHRTPTQLANSVSMSYASVSVALLSEVSSPGTWVYWLTIAGPILAEGRQHGYGHVIPFFVGGLVGFYGAALVALCLLSWGAGLHARIKQHLFLATNILLLLMGISYLARAFRG